MNNERWTHLFGEADPALVRKFLKFDADNPHIYELFKRFTFEARNTGRKRFSHWMVANRVRWEAMFDYGGRKYKLSNDFISLYARKLEYDFPHLAGFFQLKQMKHKRSEAVI